MMGFMEPADSSAADAAAMQERTGRTLDEWVDLVRHAGLDPLQPDDVRRWLKDVHDIPPDIQATIADAAARRAGWVEQTLDDYPDALYAGSKAELRPLHDGVVALAAGLGDDCAVEARSTATHASDGLSSLQWRPGHTARCGLVFVSAQRSRPTRGSAKPRPSGSQPIGSTSPPTPTRTTFVLWNHCFVRPTTRTAEP